MEAHTAQAIARINTLRSIYDTNTTKPSRTIFTKGGRTGRKIHISSTGSSVLNCGHWTKANNSHYEIKDEDIARRPLSDFCEKCFANVFTTALEAPAIAVANNTTGLGKLSGLTCSGCNMLLNKRVVARGFTACRACRKS